MRTRFGGLLFAIYLILGFYFLNMSFSFITLPGFIEGIGSILSFIAGALLILGGFNHLRTGRRAY